MKSLKKFLAVLLACVMAFGVLSVSVFAEDVNDEATDTPVADELISLIDVSVITPVDGEYAYGDYVLDVLNVTMSFIQWVDEDGNILYSSSSDADVIDATFEEGKEYTVQLTLNAADGYAFDSSYHLEAYINLNEAEIVDLSEDCKEISLSYTFVCGEAEGDDGISVNFDQILNFLKTLVVTFIRFLGSLVGIK